MLTFPKCPADWKTQRKMSEAIAPWPPRNPSVPMNKPMKMGTKPLSDDERRYVEEVIARCGGRRRFRAKACWKNSHSLMMGDDAKLLRYCEGFLDGSIPHSWVTINGKVGHQPFLASTIFSIA